MNLIRGLLNQELRENASRHIVKSNGKSHRTSPLMSSMTVFFTISALWGSIGFGLFDSLLEFFLQDFVKEGSSLYVEEVFEFVEGLSEERVIGDVIAFVE